MAKKVFVGNLPYVVGDDQLREGFSAYGEVVSAKIVLDRETQRPRGFGFVEFATDEAAQAAIDGLNGQEFHGRSITVREAEDRRRGSAPGGGFGGPGAPSRPSRPPGAGPGYGGGGGYRGGRPSEDGFRGDNDGGGFRGHGGGGRSSRGFDPPMPAQFDGSEEPRRRDKKKRKGNRGERDWDREGSVSGGGRREKRRQQDYMDYDMDDDDD